VARTTEYKGYKITATAQQRGAKWYGNFVRERDGDIFRSELTVMDACSLEHAEAQLLELARAQVYALEV
jgi:hypothetical protein